MIKDEYEILAFNDLVTANAYLDTLRDEMMRQKSLFTATGDILEDVYINLVMFTIKYKNRMDDIRAISSKIEEARTKHRAVVAERDSLKEEVEDLSKQLDKSRLESIELEEAMNKLKGNVKSMLL
jgi:predicted nuclease with TOPRIM domain